MAAQWQLHILFAMAPLAYIFVRLLGSNSGDIDDNLLVQNVQPYINPTFSQNEYNALNHLQPSSSLKRLFSFPIPKQNENGDINQVSDVFESTLIIDDDNRNNNEQLLSAYKIISTKELFLKLSESESGSIIPCTITNHVIHLYRQHKLDACVPGRRLLHGTSGSNIDNYTLRPQPQVIFFDCDDCLYFDNWQIAGHLTEKIENHCQKEFGLAKGQAYMLYKQHGTALRGLLEEGYLTRECSDSIDGFLHAVHDLPIHELLAQDTQLRDMILKINPSIRKFVFTASVSHHAQRCLDALGISDLFEGIIDVKDCNFETKHSLSSFHVAMEKAGIDDPEACLFVDDSLKNIEAARSVGWRSILVGKVGRDCGKPVTTEHSEHEIDRIHQLPEVMPELF